MKEGVIILVLFLMSFGSVFTEDSCSYKEHEGVIEFKKEMTEHKGEEVTIKKIEKENGKYTLEINGFLLNFESNNIIKYGYSESRNEIAILEENEVDEMIIRTFKKNNNSWEEYKLLNYNPKAKDIYYVDYFPHVILKGDRHLTIFVKENNKLKKIFNGYSGVDRSMYIYNGGLPWFNTILFIGGTIGYYDNTLFIGISDASKTGEGNGYGLISYKDNGYARYIDGKYWYYEYGNRTPIHYAYKEYTNDGKVYIVFDGIKGKEYDFINDPQFIGNGDKFVYFTESFETGPNGEGKYSLVEYICN